MYFDALARKYGFKLTTPVKDLPAEVMDVILYGTKGEKLKLTYDRANGHGTLMQPFEGIVNNLERRYKETQSDSMRRELEECMGERPCPDCGGKRLRKEALAVTVGGINIDDFCRKPVTEALAFIDRLELSEQKMRIADRILKEIKNRLGFLQSVGLQYLTLSRAAATLSGGESQRIRLATQIGSSLMGVLYILDEPSIGLHQRDNDKLLATLKRLRDLGNTLLVVEHDEDTMRAADYIVDIGPGAGVHGGRSGGLRHRRGDHEHPRLHHRGLPVGAEKDPRAGRAAEGQRQLPHHPGGGGEQPPGHRRVHPPGHLYLRHRRVRLRQVLPGQRDPLQGPGRPPEPAKTRPGKYRAIEGEEFLDKVIDIDQSPIGRTPRSNPATYTGLFNDIRDLFASTPDAKARGYGPGRFSFNVRGGRCEACQGDGLIKIEMHFLPDIYVPCEVCKGKRYNRETLEVRYKGKNIYEVLEMTVEEALPFFENLPRLYNKLQTLYEVGLGYVKLGQPSTELSGGEAQRVKLATELAKRSTGQTIYILDEPTTGCTPPTCTSSSKCSRSWWTWATPWWLSSTTWTSSRPPTISSTWAPKGATAAAPWWPQGRPNRWPGAPPPIQVSTSNECWSDPRPAPQIRKEFNVMSLTVGSKGRAEVLVTEANTAAAVGSGLVPVFATPYMVALMENAAVQRGAGRSGGGPGHRGHQAGGDARRATPVGMKVWAEAELTAVEGKKLTFTVRGL